MYPDYRAAYVFYTRRFIRVLPDRPALAAFLGSGERVFCLIEDDRFEVERRMLGIPLQVVDRERVGHRGMLLVSAGAGTEERFFGGLRYGVALQENMHLRIYGEIFDRDDSHVTSDGRANDERNFGSVLLHKPAGPTRQEEHD